MKKFPPKASGIISGLDNRPVIVAVAGANGAGKTTFYEAISKPAACDFSTRMFSPQSCGIDASQAAEVAAKLRQELVNQEESFIFETVFADPVGEKLSLLKNAAQQGYTMVLCFFGIADAERSEERVAMRVSQGGHDVPTDKLTAPFPRTITNLKQAIQELPCVLIFDNNDLRTPHCLAAVFQNGKPMLLKKPVPAWLQRVL